MKILVEALNTYVEKNIRDKELGYIPEEGKQFEVTEKRLKELLGNNPYQLVFVKIVENEGQEEPQEQEEQSEVKNDNKKKSK